MKAANAVHCGAQLKEVVMVSIQHKRYSVRHSLKHPLPPIASQRVMKGTPLRGFSRDLEVLMQQLAEPPSTTP